MSKRRCKIDPAPTLAEMYQHVSDNELFTMTIEEAGRWYGMTKAHYYALKRQRATQNRKRKLGA
jgi:hypothetical protein